jgi:3-hydroxybutyrate dehydrogenase
MYSDVDDRQRTYLIIGCAQGHGLFIAQQIAADGHRLFLFDSQQEILKIAEGLREHNSNVQGYIFNVLDFAEYDSFFSSILDGHKLDGILYLPRARTENNFRTLTPEAWQLDLDVGVKGAFFTSRALLPFLKENYSSIVFLSSMLATAVGSESVSYHVAKAGLEQLCRYLAVALGQNGVRVNTIRIGICIKEEVIKAGVLEKQPRWEIYRKLQPTREFSHTRDLLSLIEYLLSEKSRNITGQIFTLDGGLSLQEPSHLALHAFPGSVNG